MRPTIAEGPSASHASEQAFWDVPFTVEPNYTGWRLERYLAQKLRRLDAARIRRLIRVALVSSHRLTADTPVWPGLHFAVRRPGSEEPETPTELPEVHCDGWLLVVDKPAGLPMHPTARYHRGTLTMRVREKYGEGFAEPAHRLDRETSGLVVCGRSTEACRLLMRTFVAGHVHKE